MDIMLDLETMALTPDAAIIQIGAVVFSRDDAEPLNRIKPKWPVFQINVSLQSSLFFGLRQDAETLAWWRKQPKFAWNAVSSDAQPLDWALDRLSGWLISQKTTYDPLQLWSHGLSFDWPIINLASAITGIKIIDFHRSYRDTRTLFEQAEEAGWQKQKYDTKHIALEDCFDQAEEVRSAQQYLTRLFNTSFNNSDKPKSPLS